MWPKSVFTFVILLFGLYLTRPAMADEFHLVKQLLKQNKPQQAYRMLTKQEEKHLGEPEYDFLLARSALAAGHPNEAIFAFERVLMSNPNNHSARVELAVAYYQINELERAQQQFAQALAARPPAPLKETIDIYLSRIEEKISSRKHKLNGEVTLKQGWDSNINSATNESEIQLASGLPTYRPTEGVDKQTADSFTELINRLNYNYHSTSIPKFSAVSATLIERITTSNLIPRQPMPNWPIATPPVWGGSPSPCLTRPCGWMKFNCRRSWPSVPS